MRPSGAPRSWTGKCPGQLTTFVAAVALGAPLGAQTTTSDTMPAAVVQRFVDAAIARNVDGMMATVAPQAVFGPLPESGPAATGRDSVRAMYVRVFERTPVGFKITIASRIADGAFVTDLEHFANPDGTPAGHATWVYLVQGGLIQRAWSLRAPRGSAPR